MTFKGDCIVKMVVVDALADHHQELPREVSFLCNRSDLSQEQHEKLRALLLKWKKVFAHHKDDLECTQTPPVREHYQQFPQFMYKEMKI